MDEIPFQACKKKEWRFGSCKLNRRVQILGRVIMRSSIFIAAVGISAFVACRGSTELSPCGKANLSQVSSQSDWRSQVLKDTDGMTADSIVEAAFFLASQVTSEDSAAVATAGGTVTYAFTGFNALAVRIKAADLRTLAENGTYARITNVQVALPTYLQQCR